MSTTNLEQRIAAEQRKHAAKMKRLHARWRRGMRSSFTTLPSCCVRMSTSGSLSTPSMSISSAMRSEMRSLSALPLPVREHGCR